MENDNTAAKQRSYEISNAVLKELEKLPEEIRDSFLLDIERLSLGLAPMLAVAPLRDVILELKINGSPAYRLLYTLKIAGKMIVLAARSKTKNGPDKQLIEVATSRLKDYR